VTFTADRLRVEGADETVQDAHEERGARVQDGRLRLRGRFDGLFLRVTEAARPRPLELRLAGEGTGTLYVGERGFWNPSVKWTPYPIAGRFRIRHPYTFATSGGPDISVSLARAPGTADLDTVALVPPTEPEHVIRNP